MRIRIPPGLWYAFACISTSTALLVNCTDLPHEPGETDTRSLGDPAIPYLW
jgi:dTDP-4-dehydrorhamnose 3,5-epimerase